MKRRAVQFRNLGRHLCLLAMAGFATASFALDAPSSAGAAQLGEVRACMEPSSLKEIIQSLEANGWSKITPPLEAENLRKLALIDFVTSNIPLFQRTDEPQAEFWRQVWIQSEDSARGMELSMSIAIDAAEQIYSTTVVFERSEDILRVLASSSKDRLSILCYLVAPGDEIISAPDLDKNDRTSGYEEHPAAVQVPISQSKLDMISPNDQRADLTVVSYLADSDRVAQITQGAFQKGDEGSFLILATSLSSKPKAVTP